LVFTASSVKISWQVRLIASTFEWLDW